MTQNRYVTVLGGIALFALTLAVIAIVYTLIKGGDATAVVTSPAAIVGAVCGVLWLAVKALLARPA